MTRRAARGLRPKVRRGESFVGVERRLVKLSEQGQEGVEPSFPNGKLFERTAYAPSVFSRISDVRSVVWRVNLLHYWPVGGGLTSDLQD